jgi:EF-P beta-lysylation protein EpmB
VITSARELCALLQLDLPQFLSQTATAEFALRVPRSFVARMVPGDLNDPLLKQVLPIAAEMQLAPGYSHDPLQEKKVNPVPGLLHKYQGRVLWLLSGGCAIHCRYCFRRHFAYQENTPGRAGWEAALNYIVQNPDISEVIYSGGDPLLLKDELLAELTQKIAAIPHVTTLRIHTRLPIVIPERVTEGLVDCLRKTRLQAVVVLHCNHANELDSNVAQALQPLRQAGITLLNQSVLLRGVNDDAEVLIALSRRLFAVGVLPYYLHMLDAVQGAAHFAVSLDKARELKEVLRGALPGYLVPRLVQEKAGMASKCPVF